MAGVGAREHRPGRRDRRPTVRHADAVADLRERALHRTRDAVAEVGGGHRGAGRVARDAAHRALAEEHLDAAIAAGIGRHPVTDGVEHADHAGGERTGLRQVESAGIGGRIVAQIHRDAGSLAVDLHLGPHGNALRRSAGDRIVGRARHAPPARHPANGLDHQALGVVEHLGGVLGERLPADLPAHLEHGPLADARRSEHREVVAVPLVRHPDPHPAHPDDVLDVPVVTLNLHRGEDERPFLVDVPGRPHVRRGQRVAAVRLVGLGEDGEAVHAVVVDDRHQDHVVRGVRIAVVGRVVQEGVPALELGVELLHRPRHEIRAAQHVDRVALRSGDELAVRGHYAAREVPRHVEHAGAAGAKQGVRHPGRDALESLAEHREAHAVVAALRAGFVFAGHESPPPRRLRLRDYPPWTPVCSRLRTVLPEGASTPCRLRIARLAVHAIRHHRIFAPS